MNDNDDRLWPEEYSYEEAVESQNELRKLTTENQQLKYILFDLIQCIEGTPDETGLLQMVDHCYIGCTEVKDLIKKAKLLLKDE